MYQTEANRYKVEARSLHL